MRAHADDANPVPTDEGALFRWTGDADEVVVIGSWCDWERERGLVLHRSGDAWAASLPLRQDAFVEYAVYVDGVRVPDPRSRAHRPNGFGERNEQFWMPAATRRAIALRRRRVPRGRISRGRLELGWFAAVPHRRRAWFYSPVGEHPGAPLLVVLDGNDYLRSGRVDRTLDALIHDGAMAPVAAVFLANAGASRVVEYTASDAFLRCLLDEVVPKAARELALATDDHGLPTGGVAILGASLGGLMALHAAVRRPDVFGRAIVQSCAVFQDAELTTIELLRRAPAGAARLWLDTGDHEWLTELDDRLAELLVERGWEVASRRQHGGHDHESWAESLADALPAMFPAERVGGARPGSGQGAAVSTREGQGMAAK